MNRRRVEFAFLNVGHFLDHLFVLVFATVAAVRLATEWEMDYAALIPYATPGFIAFGVCAVPAGWLADRWSRTGMLTIFFIGIGASSMLTALANTPLQIGTGLLLIGIFAAIYHPVGLAMVIEGRERTGLPLAVNGVFGNLGVASAALLSGYLIDVSGWRNAFVVPGVVSVAVGTAYALYAYRNPRGGPAKTPVSGKRPAKAMLALDKQTLVRVFAVVFFTTAVGGLIFQSTTFALPKVFDERLQDLATTATSIGWYTFVVFALAACAQLVVGYLVDNHSIRTVFCFVAALQAGFFLLMLHASGVAALLVSIGFMLVVFGQIPINDVLIGRITQSEWRSRVYGLRYVVTFSVMACAVPLVAWLHIGWGFSTLFGVMAIAAACILAAVLMLPARGPVLARSVS